MWDGFVTVGCGELLLTLVAVALLMLVVGFLGAQVYAMIKQPAVVAPPKCAMMHCDDGEQLAKWLRDRDYSLITNEVLHELQKHYAPHARQRGESTGRHARTDLWPGMAGKLSEDQG